MNEALKVRPERAIPAMHSAVCASGGNLNRSNDAQCRSGNPRLRRMAVLRPTDDVMRLA